MFHGSMSKTGNRNSAPSVKSILLNLHETASRVAVELPVQRGLFCISDSRLQYFQSPNSTGPGRIKQNCEIAKHCGSLFCLLNLWNWDSSCPVVKSNIVTQPEFFASKYARTCSSPLPLWRNVTRYGPAAESTLAICSWDPVAMFVKQQAATSWSSEFWPVRIPITLDKLFSTLQVGDTVGRLGNSSTWKGMLVANKHWNQRRENAYCKKVSMCVSSCVNALHNVTNIFCFSRSFFTNRWATSLTWKKRMSVQSLSPPKTTSEWSFPKKLLNSKMCQFGFKWQKSYKPTSLWVTWEVSTPSKFTVFLLWPRTRCFSRFWFSDKWCKQVQIMQMRCFASKHKAKRHLQQNSDSFLATTQQWPKV